MAIKMLAYHTAFLHNGIQILLESLELQVAAHLHCFVKHHVVARLETLAAVAGFCQRHPVAKVKRQSADSPTYRKTKYRSTMLHWVKERSDSGPAAVTGVPGSGGYMATCVVL
jgi:hypothetical protein